MTGDVAYEMQVEPMPTTILSVASLLRTRSYCQPQAEETKNSGAFVPLLRAGYV